MKYEALIAKTGNGYSAHLPDLPGCIAAADTFEETAALIREAANFHVEMMAEHGESIPQPVYTTLDVEVEVPTLDASHKAAVESVGKESCNA